MKWVFEQTRERLPLFQQRLEWSLQRQDRNFNDALRMHHITPRRGFTIVFLAIAALLAYGTLAPTSLAEHWLIAAVIAGTIVGGALRGMVRTSASARPNGKVVRWSRRRAGATTARRAAKHFRAVERRVPCRLAYELGPTWLDTARDGQHRRFPLQKIKLVLHAPHVAFLFRRPMSLIPAGAIYTNNDAEQRALLEAFATAGVTCVAIDGPVEGYADPIPESRIHVS